LADGTGLSQRWWSRPLPPVVDALVWGSYSALGIACLVQVSLLPYLFVSSGRWLPFAPFAVFAVVLVVFVWFFTPLYPMLDTEFPLPEARTGRDARDARLARSLASGQSLGTAALSAIWPCIFTAGAVYGFIRGDVGLFSWLLVLVSIAVFAALGMRVLPQLRRVLPLLASRTGRSPRTSEDPSSSAVARVHRPLDALLGVVLLLALVAPAAIGTALSSLEYLEANGRRQVFSDGEVVRLANGTEFTTPPGWRTSLATGDPLDAKFGIRQSAILSPERGTDAGSVQVSVMNHDADPRFRDPSRLAQSAREHRTDVYGPSSIVHRGWRGKVTVASDDTAKRIQGIVRYSVWVELDAPGGRLFISTDNLVLGVSDASQPEELARRLIDLTGLRSVGE